MLVLTCKEKQIKQTKWEKVLLANFWNTEEMLATKVLSFSAHNNSHVYVIKQ